VSLAWLFKANGIKLRLYRWISLAIEHCALPIELQGKGLGKNFPAKQWAMWNWRWAMSIR
jgi:hypothetical protein